MRAGVGIPLAMKLTLIVVCVVLVAGCGGAKTTGGAGTVSVSQNYGETRLGPTQRQTAAKQETVMKLTERSFDVRADRGGIQEIYGVSSGRQDGKPVAWFYYVNGIAAPEEA